MLDCFDKAWSGMPDGNLFAHQRGWRVAMRPRSGCAHFLWAYGQDNALRIAGRIRRDLGKVRVRFTATQLNPHAEGVCSWLSSPIAIRQSVSGGISSWT
ncbi:hypothetical protein BCAR13_440172 [Paraburkholderia caribensis]|nr:hypothetical protein BCAR13_440172 [Paraburkholderia caribensis]